jgi:hypothetical protein
MSVFAHTKKFLTGIESLNALSTELYKEVLERLVKGQSLYDTKKIETNDEGEERQKEQTLPPEAIIVGEWTQHVVEQAAAQQLSEATLVSELNKSPVKVEETRLRALVRYYAIHLQRIREWDEKPPVVPLHLDDVQWRLEMQLASQHQARCLEPTALLNLHLTPPTATATATATTAQTNDTNLLLEFTHDELYSFFLQLESIQEQLDDLAS